MCNEFVTFASQWGLTVSLQKTKAMAAVVGSSHDHHEAVCLANGGNIEFVADFPYLGSTINGDGSLDKEVSYRIAKASCAFGSLLKPMFHSRTISKHTECLVSRAAVISTLLHGSETWAIKAPQLRKLNVFHRSCVRVMLGVSKSTQWAERLTSDVLAEWLSIGADIGDLLREHHLRWLGHVARMDQARLPKQVLFAEFPATRPAHGPKKRLRDVLSADLKAVNLTHSTWYDTRPAVVAAAVYLQSTSSTPFMYLPL